MELVLATRNSDKIREIKKLLEGLSLKLLTFKDFPLFPYPEENAVTLKGNALIKAKAVVEATERLSLADDSGLEVEVLNGAPGVFSSRFAGENVSYDDNNKKLLSDLKGLPDDKRSAIFKCVMALIKPNGTKITVEGVCPGKIITHRRGTQGFGYDPIFEVEGLGKTFAEISLAQKNRISHRAKALVKIKNIIEAMLQIEGKFLVGITGNMGCGKSTAAKFFEKWGLRIIKTDEVGHDILRKKDVMRQVIQLFGNDILNNKGEISRQRLRHKVIADEEKLSSLNKLLHPAIKKRMFELLKNNDDKVILIEAALIFESGWDFFMDRIITVYCSEDKQMERIRKNTSLGEEEVNGLLKAQFSQEEKIKRADFVISNEKGLKELEIKAKRILGKILSELPNDG